MQDYVEEPDGLFVGPTVDALTQIVADTPDSSPMSYISIVRATCRLGKLSDGMAAGAEIAEAGNADHWSLVPLRRLAHPVVRRGRLDHRRARC